MGEKLHLPEVLICISLVSLSCIGGGNGNPLQCSCLENPKDDGAWWAAVYGVAQSRTRLKQLSSSSSMTNDAEHLLVCFWVILKSSLEKHLFKSFVHFFNSREESILVHTKILNPEIKFKEGDLGSSEGKTI